MLPARRATRPGRLASAAPRALLLLAAAALTLAPAPAQAWGFTAHRLVARKAVGTLPTPLRKVFEANADYIAEQSITPDLQRATTADPNHFLDMDAFGSRPLERLPAAESDLRARFGAEATSKGRLPWRVGEVYRDLVEAFRAHDLPRALERAGTLCHFAADAHVPLHATQNHDGQLTGQRGLHSRWESELVERHRSQLEGAVLPAAAQVVADPVARVFDVLRDSYLHSLQVLVSDRESVAGRDRAETPEDDRYDDLYYSRLYVREAARLEARLSASAALTGSLWRSAWEEAGRPALDEAYRVPYVRHGARAVLLSLDGSAALLLDDAVARGVMPHLAQLRRRGATARGSITTVPSKTAPGHAALYTGTWSDLNGITGNEISPPGASVTDGASGFSSVPLRAEPLWAAAARQDVGTTVVSATQAYPFSTYFADRRFPGYYGRKLSLFDGYQAVETRDRVYAAADLAAASGDWISPLPEHEGEVRSVSFEDLGVRFDALLYDDPRDPTRGLDTVHLTLDRDLRAGVTLKPAAPRPDASAFAGVTIPLAGGEAAVYFRLFSLAPDGSSLVLYRAAPHVLRSSTPRLEPAALEASGGFVGNGAAWIYDRGGLGPTLWNGGDGTAERRYLETVALVVRQVSRLNAFAMERTASELLLSYLPYPDEALHVWYGYLDPALPRHDPALAARLRPFLDDVLRLADTEIGHLVRRGGPDTVVAVAGDHGITGVDRELRPNVALRAAGLLTLDDSGRVDLARTKAYYAPGQYVLINRTARAGGIVAEGEVAEVQRAVARTLRAVRGEAGEAVVLDVVDPRTSGGTPSMGGPAGGDLYLSVAPGYNVTAAREGEVVSRSRPRGEHFLDPARPAMHAAFALAGPGVASGARLGVVRQIDVAPTLSRLLGLEPPAQATGIVLMEALSRKAAMPPARGDASDSPTGELAAPPAGWATSP
ncbi:MAG TPA: alkaline phosphatase family protein [Vicinamibacteria bacterium]|nr:alkaline phosphatase family protein [Vicinamibacteria bacterium]